MACVHQHGKFFRGTDSLLHELRKWRLKHFLRPCAAWTKSAQRSQLFCHRTTIPRVEKVDSKGAIWGGLGAGRDAFLATFHAHRMKISGSGLHLTKGLCLPLMALPTEQHWPGSLQAMGIHDYPLCSRAPWHTLAHPDTPWHTLTHAEKCLWPWISLPLALTCPEHSNLSLEVLALWPAAQHHRAGFHHCSSPWFQVFRSSLLSRVIVLLCVNYHN